MGKQHLHLYEINLSGNQDKQKQTDQEEIEEIIRKKKTNNYNNYGMNETNQESHGQVCDLLCAVSLTILSSE